MEDADALFLKTQFLAF